MIIYLLAQNQSLYPSMERKKNPATVGPSFVMTLINDYSTIQVRYD